MAANEPNPHPHLTLTTDQLDALRDETRRRIAKEYAGNREAYFNAHGPTGYVLTAQGWAISKQPILVFDSACAITDRELIIDAEDDFRDDDGTPFKYATADGIWVNEYDESDDPRISPQVGPEPHDRTAPGPETDPIVVTGAFDLGQALLWPEAWWFDRYAATQVTFPTRITCDHRVDYQHVGGQVHPEMEIWQTVDGRWIAKLTSPEELDVNFTGQDTVWCALDERYVAHALYCNPDALTPKGRLTPLFTLLRGITSALEALVLPTGKVFLNSEGEGDSAYPSHYHTEQAFKQMETATNIIRSRRLM